MDGSPPGSFVHRDSPDKNTGVGCHALLQGSSQPRDQPQVSHTAGRFFTIWATREALCESCSVVSDSLWPHGLQPARLLSAHQALLSMGFSRQEYWHGYPRPPPADLPSIGIEPRSPALQVDSSPPEPPGKPKNTGGGSLSLLQEIFPIQEFNQGLLNCRWILYQLSYQGSLIIVAYVISSYQKKASDRGLPWWSNG